MAYFDPKYDISRKNPVVKNRNKRENEYRVQNLCLIRKNMNRIRDVPVHPDTLQSPPASLLIESGPENRQRADHNNNSHQVFAISNQPRLNIAVRTV